MERQYITSLQIYNGRAWESCDGRIWTGSRWVPYSSYNVVTLKDMSDIVDASSPDHEYIYTESGFWDWLQRWLTQFKTDLFARLDKLKGAGADGSASSSALPDIPADSGDYDFSDSSADVFTSVSFVQVKHDGGLCQSSPGSFGKCTNKFSKEGINC